MSDNHFNNLPDPKCEQLEQALACQERVTREHDNLTTQLQREAAGINGLSDALERLLGNRSGVRAFYSLLGDPNSVVVADLRTIVRSVSRKRARRQELRQAGITLAEEIARWTKELQKCESQQQQRPDTAHQIVRDSAEERAAEASKLVQLAQSQSGIAHDEDRQAAVAFDASGMGDEYERHRLAAESARDLAEEMKRRADILAHGQEGDYRSLMLDQYGKNNPDLNNIAAYYAGKFNDQETLNWLSLQHPAPRPHLDANGLAMMLMFPEAGEGEEAFQAGRAAEKSAFEQVNEIESAPWQSETLTASGGRLGSVATRAQVANFGEQLQSKGFTVTGGGSVAKEQWIPGPGGGLKGGTFVDLTVSDGTITIRVQTVDTLADGATLTPRESVAAARIRAIFPNDILITIPKPQKPY